MRKFLILLLPGFLAAQDFDIYREEQPTKLQAYMEVFGSTVYIGQPVPDLVGYAVPGTGDLLNVLRARAGASISFANKFTIGIAGMYSGEATSDIRGLPVGVSEAYVQLDTFVTPVGGQGVVRIGRQIINFGQGLAFGDYHGFGANAVRLGYRFSPAWEWYLDVLYVKSNESGARQVEKFYYPFAYYDDAKGEIAYKWISTKYDLETWAIFLERKKGPRDNYEFYVYAAMMSEQRLIGSGFNPYYLGGYIAIGPIGNFYMDAELGYMTGIWDSRRRIYGDLSDQIYDVVGEGRIDLNAYAIGIRANYDFTDQVTGGVSFFTFSGDNPNTAGMYEAWISPMPRTAGIHVFSNWTHWTGMGEVFTWNYRPDNWRSIYFLNPTNFVAANLNLVYKAFPIQQSMVIRFDGFAYAEAASPPGVDPYLGAEADVAIKFTYADIADIGITFGYFQAGPRLQNTGWSRPSPIELYLQGSVPDYQVLKITGGSYVARLWVYRSVNLF